MMGRIYGLLDLGYYLFLTFYIHGLDFRY